MHRLKTLKLLMRLLFHGLQLNSANYTSYNNHIAREILDVYFELKEKRASNGTLTSTVEQPILPTLSEEVLNEDAEEQKSK